MFVLVALFSAASTSCFIGAAIRQVAAIFEALEAARWMLALFESLEIGHLASYLHHPPAEQLIGVFFLGQVDEYESCGLSRLCLPRQYILVIVTPSFSPSIMF